MRILTIDIGTGTQDIFLYDSRLDIENGYKLILPSPTLMIARRVRQATLDLKPILLTGVTMGGGPSAWACEDHVKAGLVTYATPQAARTLNDDLNEVASLGIKIISEEEAEHLPDSILRIVLQDFDYPLVQSTFENFGVSIGDLDAIALAVFDHGDAPPDISDRKFRFDYLDSRIKEKNNLSAFAYPADDIPVFLTRMKAAAQSAKEFPGPVFVMDTAPAAVLGTLFDPLVSSHKRKIVANIGNFHTLAFRLGPAGIEGVFEHHTSLLDAPHLECYLRKLADSTLTNQEVYTDHGHGALLYDSNPLDLSTLDFEIISTGPRRSLTHQTGLRVYPAVPFGDMMLAGCIGLLAAVADLQPEWSEQIWTSLSHTNLFSVPPWETL